MVISEKVHAAGEKLRNERSNKILRAALFFVAGFLFSLGSVLETLHPFGVSVIAVSGRRYALFTAAGALLGTLLGGLDAAGARYVAAILLALLGAIAVAALDIGYTPHYAMAVAFVSSFLTGLVLCLRMGANGGEYMLLLGESILSGGGAYFFYRALHADYRRLRFYALPLSDVTCIVISAAISVMNTAAFSLGIITPARVLTTLAVLTAARYFGDRWGLMLALGFGFVLSLSGGETLFLVGAYAFSVMAASLFLSISRFAFAGVYLCSVAFFSIASGAESALSCFLDSLLGTALFLLLPRVVTAKLEKLGEAGMDVPQDGTLRQSLVLKLRFAGAAMATISDNVEQVREKITAMTRKENEASRPAISEAEYTAREVILEKTNQIRTVAADQFFSISGMLEDLAHEFDEAEIFDAAASAKIRRLLGEFDIFPQSISVVEDKFGRIRVEILTDSDADKLDNPLFAKEIGKICNRYFEAGQLTSFQEETMLSFYEKALYRLDIGSAQYSADGHLCGDTIKLLHDSKGHSILIISDGMGKGARAALDGAMGAGLLSRLLHAGFGFDSALKVVNCALLVKSNDESLATLDIANIDLFTGKCEIFKAGAPASYIIRGGNVTKCALSSLPAGILRGIEFAKRTAVLRLDDCVLLCSDGITDLGDDWLYQTVAKAGEASPQALADYILAAAMKASGDCPRDDMSIIAARLLRN